MSETKVHLLDFGALELDSHQLFWPSAPTRGPVRIPVYGALIDHKEGRFLFDTGFDQRLIDRLLGNPPSRENTLNVPGQLALLGLRPSDITHVVNSHLHIDHVGGNRFCTAATTLCHRLELAAAANPEPFELAGYCDMSFAPGLRKNSNAPDPSPDYTPHFETLSGDVEFAKGLTLFETPGHSPGHYSLLVQLANRRPMLFTADASYTAMHLRHNLIAGLHSDVKQAFKSLQRLRDLAEKYDAELFYSHDIELWKTWRHGASYYA